jgi:hypothetical protein
MRAARWPAFFALSSPTAATGTPGGIWATDSNASKPPSAESRLDSGTPMTGSSVCAACDDRAARPTAGAGDDHAQPAHLRVAAVVGDDVGLAVGRHDADLVADPALVEHLARLLHDLHVGLGAHDDPHARGVGLQPRELRLGLRLRIGILDGRAGDRGPALQLAFGDV